MAYPLDPFIWYTLPCCFSNIHYKHAVFWGAKCDHWSSISVSVIQPALRNTASSQIRGSCQPICRILSNSSGSSMNRGMSVDLHRKGSLGRTSERLETKNQNQSSIVFEDLKVVGRSGFEVWAREIAWGNVKLMLDFFWEPLALSFLSVPNAWSCLTMLDPLGLPMWKSRPSSSNLIMVVRHGGSQMHSVEAVLVNQKSHVTAIQLRNVQKQCSQLLNSEVRWVHKGS